MKKNIQKMSDVNIWRTITFQWILFHVFTCNTYLACCVYTQQQHDNTVIVHESFWFCVYGMVSTVVVGQTRFIGVSIFHWPPFSHFPVKFPMWSVKLSERRSTDSRAKSLIARRTTNGCKFIEFLELISIRTVLWIYFEIAYMQNAYIQHTMRAACVCQAPIIPQ